MQSTNNETELAFKYELGLFRRGKFNELLNYFESKKEISSIQYRETTFYSLTKEYVFKIKGSPKAIQDVEFYLGL